MTLVYTPDGKLVGLQTDDGTTTYPADIRCQQWADYVVSNGQPPASIVPPAPPALPANVQAVITDFKQYLSLTAAQSQAQLGISVKQDQFNRDVIAALAYINSILTK